MIDLNLGEKHVEHDSIYIWCFAGLLQTAINTSKKLWICLNVDLKTRCKNWSHPLVSKSYGQFPPKHERPFPRGLLSVVFFSQCQPFKAPTIKPGNRKSPPFVADFPIHNIFGTPLVLVCRSIISHSHWYAGLMISKLRWVYDSVLKIYDDISYMTQH